jgi:hypothetical protein
MFSIPPCYYFEANSTNFSRFHDRPTPSVTIVTPANLSALPPECLAKVSGACAIISDGLPGDKRKG